MSDSQSGQQPSRLQPHRIARADQQLATAGGRLDKLLADYRNAAAEEGSTSAALVTSLAMRLGHDHMDVAMIATVAMQRLIARDEATGDDSPAGDT